MKNIQLGRSGLKVPVISVGCMRMIDIGLSGAETFIREAIDMDAIFFDHADIYGQGECERLFSKAINMTDDLREKMILQSKCGIASEMYDSSKEHILKAVEGSLQRLKTDYLDVLLIHRPDALVEPEEVAEAFAHLHSSGKVRHFGVSNHNPMQIQLLEKYLNQPIVANQLQMSVMHAGMIDNGMHVNMLDESAVMRDGSALDFCRLNDITVQPWSPFQSGFFDGVFLGDERYPKINHVIDDIAKKYSVSNTTIAMAWLLRHPAKLNPVTGTMNISRLKECLAATNITLSREDWYQIYLAAGYTLP